MLSTHPNLRQGRRESSSSLVWTCHGWSVGLKQGDQTIPIVRATYCNDLTYWHFVVKRGASCTNGPTVRPLLTGLPAYGCLPRLGSWFSLDPFLYYYCRKWGWYRGCGQLQPIIIGYGQIWVMGISLSQGSYSCIRYSRGIILTALYLLVSKVHLVPDPMWFLNMYHCLWETLRGGQCTSLLGLHLLIWWWGRLGWTFDFWLSIICFLHIAKLFFLFCTCLIVYCLPKKEVVCCT